MIDQYVLTPEWDEGAYDDILAEIRAHGSLDLLEPSLAPGLLDGTSPSDVVGEARYGAAARYIRAGNAKDAKPIGKILPERHLESLDERDARLAREAEARRLRLEEQERRQEAQLWFEQEAAESRARLEAERLARRARRKEELEAKLASGKVVVRTSPLLINDTLTCHKCGMGPQAIILPAPGWGGGGSFVQDCIGCRGMIGVHSKRLTEECYKLREIVDHCGWQPSFKPISHPWRVRALSPTEAMWAPGSGSALITGDDVRTVWAHSHYP